MKKNIILRSLRKPVLVLFIGMLCSAIFAQEEGTVDKSSPKPVKNTFPSVWIIDNQTVMVPIKGTLEFDIQHRFGTVKNGVDDLFGIFAPSNIRFGMNYAPIKNLSLGVGLTKDRMIVDGSAKYSILRQMDRGWSMPVSVTYYGYMSYDAQKDEENSIYYHETDRLRYFHQLIIARKISDRFSVQVAGSLSHQNVVQGYAKKVDSLTTKVEATMEHEHFAVSAAGRFRITNKMAIIANYDQPITKHLANNPNPNVSFGIEIGTSGHSFQIFAGNYPYLNPQRNNIFNKNSPFPYTDANGNDIKGGNFLIGFNITRLWNL